ncbi:MAG: hypothetical protein EOO50_12280 [Flavobacterium sp.]|uniref:right-handed parallel beta-helix repeat-containing protein n=1 Tax=Flavobacterium sp. TaxID=239 RepID=UPI0012016D8E|nr:right-handed parallel beta-helix repeat-containing protein [Flavobacterium sp.]RZJ65786.1 MAG: hypothetical protein EOO50_12280 [Flavobacterium sp.]
MKKAMITMALLALFSCSDEDFLKDTEPSKKESPTARELRLLEFDSKCITLSTFGNDPSGSNRECLQNQINLAKANGYDGLHIGAIDFYVNVTFATDKSLKIPSDFALIMEPATTLRVTPNSAAGYALMDIGGLYENGADIHDVEVSGGQLIGDRILHNNPVINGHLVRIRSAHFVKMEGVTMREANCDGLYVTGNVISNQPNYTQPSNIAIHNCTFDSNRRSNISITDGYAIEITSSTFKNAGVNMGTSAGASPKMQVNIEGDRYWADPEHTQLVWLKHPHDIKISNNVASGGAGASFYASLTDHVLIQNNSADTPIGYTYGDNISILGNTVVNPGGTGIAAGFNSATSTVNHDNLIDGNSIIDCNIGLVLNNQKTIVSNNKFKDCASYAISFGHSKDNQIIGNNISSTVPNSSGIKVTNPTMADNLEIRKNTIFIDGGTTSSGISLKNLNTAAGQENFKLYIMSNTVSTTGLCLLTSVTGAEVIDNQFITMNAFTISSARNLIMKSNSLLNNAPTANVNTLLLKDNVETNTIALNNIENISTNANAHATQIMDCANLNFSGNTLKHNMTRTLHMTNLTDCTIAENNGDIDTVSLFLFGTNMTNCLILNNKAVLTPHTRESINGVVIIQ